MTQNIYDNQEFFQNYSQLPRSVEGLDGAPEWPALQALLPEIAGRHVLDLGCGFGWFCRWAAGQGATRVLGVDVSERMLARARAETDSAIVSYTRADLEHFAPPSGNFHLAYSSLAFHYIENMAGLVAKVHAALAPGGKLVFSAEHPIMTAPANQGWLSDASGQVSWPVNGISMRVPGSPTGWPGAWSSNIAPLAPMSTCLSAPVLRYRASANGVRAKNRSPNIRNGRMSGSVPPFYSLRAIVRKKITG